MYKDDNGLSGKIKWDGRFYVTGEFKCNYV